MIKHPDRCTHLHIKYDDSYCDLEHEDCEDCEDYYSNDDAYYDHNAGEGE